MSEFELRLWFPSGTVLIGGHSPASEGTHAAHARLPDGRPFIPSTALRGALRESLEALLRANEIPACAGGDGIDPANPQGAQPLPCQLDSGRPCRSCRLFGGARPTLPQGSKTFSALVLGEAVPPDDAAVDWQVRHGVSINRKRQSAEDKRLFRRQVPEEGLLYIARGRIAAAADDELCKDFKAAVEATKHIGAGKSGGLARVEMSIEWRKAAAEPRPLPEGSEIELSIVLTTPASIGQPLAIGNFRDTRRHIPGSALRGAVGFALAETLADPDHDADFQALVSPDAGGAIFDFLYPVDDAPAATGLSGPFPLTARACKANTDHGTFDTLLHRIAIEAIRSPEEAFRLREQLQDRCPVKGCHSVLRSPSGERRLKEAPPTRLSTRVAMDRRRGSARNEALFSHALIERGVRFVGRIRNIPAQGREHLGRALGQPLSVGRGRAMGWGAIAITRIAPPAPLPSIEARGKAFDAALRALLQAELGLPVDRVERLIAFTLLSPLIPRVEDDDGRAAIAEALGGDVTFLVVARRFDLERGWDQRSGPRPVARAVRTGSVFVAELPEGRGWQALAAALARIEAQGVGDRTREGFGRLLCFDPFICEGTQAT